MGGKYWKLCIPVLSNGHLRKAVQSLCSEMALRTVATIAVCAVGFCRGLGDTHRWSPVVANVPPCPRFPLKLSVFG